MKFLAIVKGPELTKPPPRALLDAIQALGDETKDAGVFIDMGGLKPTAEGVRTRIAKGKLSITDGPFSEAKEVIGGFMIYDVTSKEEAVEWTRRFMELHLKHFPEWEGETELRPLFEERPPDW